MPDVGFDVLNDTYSFLLENPRFRNYSLLAKNIPYVSRNFDERTYAVSRGRSFETAADAYADWLTQGKRDGREYAPGSNTVLKIVLKVKDESYLLPHWIAHHEKIVGRHNLVVMNCGSEQPEFLSMLESYGQDILILNYPHYYDNIHSTRSNRELFSLLERSCKYLMILDADEFLIGCREGVSGPSHVVPLLSECEEAIVSGTWLNLAERLREDAAGKPDWTGTYKFEVGPEMIRNGTIAGKAAIRSDRIFDAGHLGHCLHTPETIDMASPRSFGHLCVLHITELPIAERRRRILRHLHARGIVSPEIDEPAVVEELLRGALHSNLSEWWNRAYMERYLDLSIRSCPETVAVDLLGLDTSIERHNIADAFSGFDFNGMLAARRVEIAMSS